MGQRGSPGATERCPLSPKSAFFVKLSEPLPKPFQPVVFKEALYNQQDPFNLTAGVFSCTTPGVYNFAFDNEMFQRSVKIGLMRNGIRVRWKQAQAKDSHKHALGTVIVQLEKEDKVWLESKLNEAESEKETPQMMFFGYLLYGN
ncbi:hibernation-associated plasma protein HP-25-like [Tursiops truncatus]|uniref:Hibernation-associated plasma protein HP-25-like n=1 Tax=Tursiops truncatus TaxID=9739 RepID=A0A2U4CQ95_TURTR|nr:hibernation-associated plasma protein HP-25-like [Tursiops truncatus]